MKRILQVSAFSFWIILVDSDDNWLEILGQADCLESAYAIANR